jgi:hypothetical protein
MKVKLNIFNAF